MRLQPHKYHIIGCKKFQGSLAPFCRPRNQYIKELVMYICRLVLPLPPAPQTYKNTSHISLSFRSAFVSRTTAYKHTGYVYLSGSTPPLHLALFPHATVVSILDFHSCTFLNHLNPFCWFHNVAFCIRIHEFQISKKSLNFNGHFLFVVSFYFLSLILKVIQLTLL